MKVVVIGDVSLAGQYHVGDEAMTEVAIAQLKRHGADVTLVAGDPELSAAHYDVRTIPRLGFLGTSTARKRAMLTALDSALTGDTASPESMAPAVEAVSAADALVIAGGGNLNSLGEHAIFERLALTRIARSFGVPLFVSSQTVGPELTRREREMVAEIVDHATVFGVRERWSAELVRDLAADPGTVVHTFDDAVLAPRLGSSGVPEVELSLPRDYVVGSFTHQPGAIEVPDAEYHRTVAAALDRIVATCDVDIVLVPHIGVLGVADETDRDHMGHVRIAELMETPRVHLLPVLSAAQVVAVTAGAEFTVSTRYHPVVFGPAVGVPAVGLVTSHFAGVRMRGGLENVGMGSCAVPLEGWNDLFGPTVISGLVRDRSALRARLEGTAVASVAHQSAWWDGIAAAVRGTGDVLREDIPLPSQYEWGTAADHESFALFTTATVALERTRDRLALQAREMRDTKRRLRAATAAVEEAATTQRGLQRQIDDLRHRQRPPGAGLRDGVRRRLRRWRERR